jgi:hypothetical protein
MRVVLAAALATLALAAPVRAAEGYQAQRCAALPVLEAACPCDQAVGRGPYVSCISQAARKYAQEKGDANAVRVGEVVRCAAQSVCGRPGSVACQTGPRCRIVASAERCRDMGGTVTGRRSCCADCPAATPSTTKPAD